jgi:hypothetical protein
VCPDIGATLFFLFIIRRVIVAVCSSATRKIIDSEQTSVTITLFGYNITKDVSGVCRKLTVRTIFLFAVTFS